MQNGLNHMRSGIFHTPFMRPERTGRETFDWAIRLAVEADQAGFDDFMIGEHATQAWESIPNPEIVIGAAAGLTKRLRFAPMTHLLPLRDPASVAIMTGWLSQILEGRYFIGFGRGAYPNDFVLHGHKDWFKSGQPDWTEARIRMSEAMEIIPRIWKREPFYYEGQYYKGGFPEVSSEGGDFEDHAIKDHSPWGGALDIEVAVTAMTMNSPSIAWAGEEGYAPSSFFGGSELLRSHWDTYSAVAAEHGHTPDRSRWSVVREMFVAETDQEAKRHAIEGGMGECWRRYLLPIYKRFGIFNGYVDDSGTQIDPSEIDVEFLAEHVWLCGTPDTVVEKIERMVDLSGGRWGTMCMVSHDYIDNPEPWIQSMNMIAKEVIPRIEAPSPVAI
jgi:alkanesulfonate monooxygenase SsuD/methylene tetrahydromethanopterin reductase-like flavin-dependent oxidoreductase (luciferase family)